MEFIVQNNSAYLRRPKHFVIELPWKPSTDVVWVAFSSKGSHFIAPAVGWRGVSLSLLHSLAPCQVIFLRSHKEAGPSQVSSLPYP